MLAVTAPLNEEIRLAALHDLDILDTPPDDMFDSVTRLATRICNAPIAAVTLVDRDRQWFKSVQGIDIRETPRELSFCSHALLHPDDVLVVPDARLDPRFASNPLVTGNPNIRFYAGVPLREPSGQMVGALCIVDSQPRREFSGAVENLRDLAKGVDVALRLHASARNLNRLAMTDPLTKLANRTAFDARLRFMSAEYRDGTAAGLGLLMLDLDNFKGINDLFGHPGGDSALIEAARRMKRAARGCDLVARLGGDEFAVLCPGITTEEDLFSIAARIHAAMADPFSVHQQLVSLRTSVGFAMLPGDARTGRELMRVADAALYLAKRAGRSQTRRYLSVDDASPPRLKSVAACSAGGAYGMDHDLRAALLPGGTAPFTLCFQPIFQAGRASRPGPVAGLEALVRWPNIDGSLMMPSEFVPFAEAGGMITHLDRWVLRTACTAAAAWPLPLVAAVNFSAANFHLLDTCEVIESVLRETGLPPHRLRIEVTESVLVRDPTRALSLMTALRSLGVAISLDDFGGGHGTLAYLRDYPFDEIKIDQSLVKRLLDGPEAQQKARAIITAIIQLGQAMDVSTIAEGVETQEQLSFLQTAGATMVQGYLLSRPIRAGALGQFFSRCAASQPRAELSVDLIP